MKKTEKYYDINFLFREGFIKNRTGVRSSRDEAAIECTVHNNSYCGEALAPPELCWTWLMKGTQNSVRLLKKVTIKQTYLTSFWGWM